MVRADGDGISSRERVGRIAAVESLGDELPEVVASLERGQVGAAVGVLSPGPGDTIPKSGLSVSGFGGLGSSRSCRVSAVLESRWGFLRASPRTPPLPALGRYEACVRPQQPRPHPERLATVAVVECWRSGGLQDSDGCNPITKVSPKLSSTLQNHAKCGIHGIG
jgi:hypothetical protein